MSDRGRDFLRGLVIGGLIGSAMGFLFAPTSGRETREKISSTIHDWKDQAIHECAKAAEKSRRAYGAAVQRLAILEQSARKKAEGGEANVGVKDESATEYAHNKKSRLKRAIVAGLEAFREAERKSA